MAPSKWEVVTINIFLSFLWQCRIWAILLNIYSCRAKETDSNFPMSQHDLIEEASTICHIVSFATILIPQLTQTEIIHHNNKCKHTYVHTNTPLTMTVAATTEKEEMSVQSILCTCFYGMTTVVRAVRPLNMHMCFCISFTTCVCVCVRMCSYAEGFV